jgi:hypothetical protein
VKPTSSSSLPLERPPFPEHRFCNIGICDDPNLFETLIAYSKVTCSSV